MKYSEIQTFNQKWLVILSYTILAICTSLFFLIIIVEKNYAISIFTFVVGILVFALLKSARLTIIIDNVKIRYKFFPIHRTYKSILLNHPTKIEVVQYEPIAMFGGWGIRMNKTAICYSISGNFALKISDIGRKQIYLGTSQPEKLKKFLENIKQ